MIPYEYTIPCNSRSNWFVLVPIGDLHAGIKNFAENDLREVIEYVRKTPNAYWLGMGDYAEFINYTDKRFDPYNISDWCMDSLDNLAQKQAEYICGLFEPIKNKCIGLIEGNHEETIRLKYHFSVVDYMASMMKTVNLTDCSWIRLKFKREPQGVRNVIVFAAHGSSAAIKLGGKINKITDIGNFFEADIYLMGHVHDRTSAYRPRLYITDKGEPRIYDRQKLFVLTGTFFKTYQEFTRSYGAKKLYPPTPMGVEKIRIEPFSYATDGKDTTPRITIME